MFLKKYVNIFLIFFSILVIFLFFFFKHQNQKEITISEPSIKSEDVGYNSNIIENVNYTTKDADGNEYLINAIQGEIDYSNEHYISQKS